MVRKYALYYGFEYVMYQTISFNRIIKSIVYSYKSWSKFGKKCFHSLKSNQKKDFPLFPRYQQIHMVNDYILNIILYFYQNIISVYKFMLITCFSQPCVALIVEGCCLKQPLRCWSQRWHQWEDDNGNILNLRGFLTFYCISTRAAEEFWLISMYLLYCSHRINQKYYNYESFIFIFDILTINIST